MAQNPDTNGENSTDGDKHTAQGGQGSGGGSSTSDAPKDQSEKGGQIAQDSEQTTGQAGTS
jgi:hypothetical protein